LISPYVFDGGRLVVAHAAWREEMHGRGSGGFHSPMKLP
jgi:protein phosphatase